MRAILGKFAALHEYRSGYCVRLLIWNYHGLKSRCCTGSPRYTDNRVVAAGAAPPAGAAPSYQGEMPHEDVKDDPNLQAPTPSAPGVEQMGVVAGYERIGFSASESG